MLMKSNNHVFLGAFCSGHPVILEFLQLQTQKKDCFLQLAQRQVEGQPWSVAVDGELGEPLVPGINWCSVLMSLAEKQAPLKT